MTIPCGNLTITTARRHAEGCPSGRRGATGNRTAPERGLKGSNPFPSATGGAVAQLGERQNRTLEVRGSNPLGSTIVVIPARWASTRFPGKILHPIAGKPLLRWVWEHAVALPVAGVWVATDTDKVAQAVTSWGGQALLTPPELPSGTDRIARAVQEYGLPGDFILNLQGDEPLLASDIIRTFLEKALARPDWDLATLTTTFSHTGELTSPHTVKVAVDIRGYALYFSRSPIPFVRDDTPRLSLYRKHVGVYLYRRESLFRLVNTPSTPLETAEKLEQLRALETGLSIRVIHLPGLRLQAVDTPEDAKKAEQLLLKGT